MLKMVCVLIVQLPIHVMNGAPEETIHRKSEGDNKSERKRWRSMAVIMSMSGVTMVVSGCYNNIELNWRYKWIKLTLKASERDENGTWMKVMRKVNAVKTEVYEHEERRIQWRWRCLHVTLKAINLFVVQSTGSAPDPTGSAKTGNVSARIMCVTAMPTVVTVLTKETAVSLCLWHWCWWW